MFSLSWIFFFYRRHWNHDVTSILWLRAVYVQTEMYRVCALKSHWFLRKSVAWDFKVRVSDVAGSAGWWGLNSWGRFVSLRKLFFFGSVSGRWWNKFIKSSGLTWAPLEPRTVETDKQTRSHDSPDQSCMFNELSWPEVILWIWARFDWYEFTSFNLSQGVSTVHETVTLPRLQKLQNYYSIHIMKVKYNTWQLFNQLFDKWVKSFHHRHFNDNHAASQPEVQAAINPLSTEKKRWKSSEFTGDFGIKTIFFLLLIYFL